MTTQVFLFRLSFAIICLTVAASYLWRAYNRAEIVVQRGEGKSKWARFWSGSRRMLNGENQKWEIGAKLCNVLVFLYLAASTTYSLITSRTAGENRFFFVFMLITLLSLLIVSVITGIKAKGARRHILALPDPLELEKQKQALETILAQRLEGEEDLILEIQGALDTFERFRAMQEGETVGK